MIDSVSASLRSRPWMFAAVLTFVLVAANIFAEPSFGDPSNWPAQLATLAPVALIAMGSTPAIVSGGGGLDLSIGPLAVLINVILVQSMIPNGIDSAWLCVPILLGLGVAVGAVNGLLVSVGRFAPVIATLCVTFIITGVNLKLGVGGGELTNNWTGDLAESVGPVPGAVLLLGVPIAIWLGLSRTPFHRVLYGVGGNEVTAFASGINVRATRVSAYALGGLFAAFGGIALTALVQSSQAGSTSFYVLVGLTAVALGGTPLLGGRGGMTGAFMGASVLYLVQTLLSALSVDPNWINVVFGAMLLVGVVISAGVALSTQARTSRGLA